jgi:hypothetical protein
LIIPAVGYLLVGENPLAFEPARRGVWLTITPSGASMTPEQEKLADDQFAIDAWRWCLSDPNVACLIFAEATNMDTHAAAKQPMTGETIRKYIEACVYEEMRGEGRAQQCCEGEKR